MFYQMHTSWRIAVVLKIGWWKCFWTMSNSPGKDLWAFDDLAECSYHHLVVVCKPGVKKQLAAYSENLTCRGESQTSFILMTRAKYKGISSYKINMENTKNTMKQQVFTATGLTCPFEFRPEKKRKKRFINHGKNIRNVWYRVRDKLPAR